jgi:hypothetical protein
MEGTITEQTVQSNLRVRPATRTRLRVLAAIEGRKQRDILDDALRLYESHVRDVTTQKDLSRAMPV